MRVSDKFEAYARHQELQTPHCGYEPEMRIHEARGEWVPGLGPGNDAYRGWQGKGDSMSSAMVRNAAQSMIRVWRINRS